nr:protein PIN-LIKES 6 [Tanacetum cinerariifolium]
MTSTSCSYVVITPHLRKIVFVNQRVDDENVDKVLLSLKDDSRVTVHDYDEHIIKSILFDGGSDYTRYQMYITRIGSSVKTTGIRLYDMRDKLLDDEVFRGNCVAIALYIMWDAMIPCILLALGGNLTDGPGSSKLGLRTTAAIIIGRLIIVPAAGLGIVMTADHLGLLPPDDKMFRFILLLQHSMPTSVLSGTHQNLDGIKTGIVYNEVTQISYVCVAY